MRATSGGLRSIPFMSKDRVLHGVFINRITVSVVLERHILAKQAFLAHTKFLA